MNDMKAVRHRYKQRYDFAASEVVGAFDELRSLDWSLEIASLSDVEMSKRWIGAVDPNGVARLPPNGGWDWVKLYNGYLKNPSAFVCAIKSEGKLCALIGG
ncbi:hypothetical protein ECO10026_25603, partial [Escherichia coli O26:H11 str. CVM10026]